MKKEKLAIVGVFYDGYYDVWEDFLELFFMHWKNCPYNLYIVNNEIDLDFDREYDVQVIKAGKEAEYSRKVQKILQEVDAQYYLILLEDFFIQKDLSIDCLEKILEIMERDNIAYYRMTIPEFVIRKKHCGVVQISKDDEYTVSCQPSIWKKEFLEECIGKHNYNAWIFEGIYAYSSYAHSEVFLEKCRIDYNNPLNLRHGAVQGKMIPKVYQDFLKEGYKFRNNREVLSPLAYSKQKIKQIIKTYLPKKVVKRLKKLIGKESILSRYEEEIRDIMFEMNLE